MSFVALFQSFAIRAKLARFKNEAKQDQGSEPEDERQKGGSPRAVCIPSEENFGPIEVDAVVHNPQTSPIYKQARSLLRQYLNEIGYSEKILDVRSFRVKNLLGIVANNDTVLHDG